MNKCPVHETWRLEVDFVCYLPTYDPKKSCCQETDMSSIPTTHGYRDRSSRAKNIPTYKTRLELIDRNSSGSG